MDHPYDIKQTFSVSEQEAHVCTFNVERGKKDGLKPGSQLREWKALGTLRFRTSETALRPASPSIDTPVAGSSALTLGPRVQLRRI